MLEGLLVLLQNFGPNQINKTIATSTRKPIPLLSLSDFAFHDFEGLITEDITVIFEGLITLGLDFISKIKLFS